MIAVGLAFIILGLIVKAAYGLARCYKCGRPTKMRLKNGVPCCGECFRAWQAAHPPHVETRTVGKCSVCETSIFVTGDVPRLCSDCKRAWEAVDLEITREKRDA